MAKKQKNTAPQDQPRRGFRRFALGSLAIGAVALAGRYARRRRGAPAGGHKAPDLAAGKPHPGPDHRAPEAFRPDPTAPVPESERDALRPATGKPTLVAGSDVKEGRAPAGT
ncbi:hypothetical protein [Sphingosinithalassobacter sp. LHW66-3]|uniref:hypothetical protein n=1 Tax=Sphingosinithalassobacter sp. LHW66-3 TaxID=3424718 RepID=UPI003D6C5C20